MGAHFEQTCECGHGIIRVYDGWRSYQNRSPFRFALFVVRQSSLAYFKGLRSEPDFTRQQWKAINDCLDQNGFSGAWWEEHKSDRTIIRRLTVRKDYPMSIEASAKKADEHLAKALTLAQADKTDFVPLIEAVQAAHPSAIELANTENMAIGARLRDPRLLALADATDALTVAGMADPDQSHKMHSEIIHALKAMAEVSAKVQSREAARLP